MKKLFLAGAIALFGLVNAQVNYGLKAGYSHSTVHFNNVQDEPTYKPGFYAGFFTEYKIGNNVSFEGDLLYSNLGFKINTTKENKIVLKDNEKIVPLDDPYYRIKNNYKLILNTVMLPLSLKYHFGKELSLFGGVNLGYTFTAVVKQEQQYNLNANRLDKQDKNYIDMLNKFSVAPFAGVAYNFSEKYFVEARYNYGLTNIYKPKTEGLKGYNRFFQVGLGYRF